MSDSSPLNARKSLALIGCGYWGKNLARNFHELGALHTICETAPELRNPLAQQYSDIAIVDDLDDILENPEIDKIAIAAPAAQHFAIAKSALLKGKDLLVEKPLCLDLEEARELIDTAKACNRILMVGHLLHYHPCIERLKSLIRNNELGELYQINANRLNLGKIRIEENVLWSFAPHDISVILSIMGESEIVSLRSIGDHYLSNEVADTSITSIKFANGARAQISVSWLNPFKEQKMTVIGSKAMAVFDDTLPWDRKLGLHRAYLSSTHPQRELEYLKISESEPLRAECEHFLQCCQSRQTPTTDGLEGLRVLRVLTLAEQSLHQGGMDPILRASCPTIQA